jgi:glucose-1-phosphate adenylyltransferase
MKNVLAVILGGGQGTRLFPLTKFRAKPAVPIAGKFRLIDIPISSCIHWDIRKIYVLTQFNTESLHRHIFNTYKFDRFSRGFVQILAAQQTSENANWYQGTADAVRKNIDYIRNQKVDYVLVLSGDQLFRINLGRFIGFHQQKGADITIASTPVSREAASGFGILKINGHHQIVDFMEKPHDPKILDLLKMPDSFQVKEINQPFLASMGIYVFNKETLIRLLEASDSEDFGKQIIPSSISSHNVSSYIFPGYWEDIGTIRAFFEANLDFTNPAPRFNFYDEQNPIYTNARFLPGSIIKNCSINRALICDGSILEGSEISHSVIGLRAVIKEGSTVDRVVVMGADHYRSSRTDVGERKIGIGKNCTIRNAILDKNVRIGDNVIIDYKGKEKNKNESSYYIRDGIVVVPKNGIIPAGSRIL